MERSMPWGGTVIGDAGPYSDSYWSYVWRKFFTRNIMLQGVFQDEEDELEVTNPAGTTIRIKTGAAMVGGKYYEILTTPVDFAVVAPGGGSNYYTVVLRKSWIGGAAQTVRAALLGPDAANPPPVTQTDLVVWEIALATVQITNVGVITITDLRGFCKYSDAFPIHDRQGLTGATPDTNNLYWGSPGNVDSVPFGNIICQIGAVTVNIAPGNVSGSSVVTFPIPFSTSPFVIGTTRGLLLGGVASTCKPSPTFHDLVVGISMTVWASRDPLVAGADSAIVYWMAIGPKA